MKVALEELSDAPVNRIDKLDKIWARDVRELSYDIEDSIGMFTVRGSGGGEPLQPHGFNKFIGRSPGLLTRARIHHKIATDLRDIRSRVIEVSQGHQVQDPVFSIRSDPTTSPSMVDRTAAIFGGHESSVDERKDPGCTYHCISPTPRTRAPV
jgi:hypothetical protein